MLYKVVLTSESVDEILKCDYLNVIEKSGGAVFFFKYFTYQTKEAHFELQHFTSQLREK